MADLVYPDSDWAALGAKVIDAPKAFKRLERPTPRQAALEKELLELRAKSGRKVKRAPKKNGRPLLEIDMNRVAQLRRKGLSENRIAQMLGVHRNTLRNRAAAKEGKI
jgi:DNA-binding protein Fis